jgi:hypothetical protein
VADNKIESQTNWQHRGIEPPPSTSVLGDGTPPTPRMPTMPKTRLTATLLATASCLALAACDDASSPAASLEHVTFDAVEVANRLAHDPDATFLVDLEVGTVVHFDQSEQPLDFDHFYIQCPSMPAPIEMNAWLKLMQLDADADYWNLRAEGTALDEGFRADGTCDKFCDAGGGDCVIVCG